MAVNLKAANGDRIMCQILTKKIEKKKKKKKELIVKIYFREMNQNLRVQRNVTQKRAEGKKENKTK